MRRNNNFTYQPQGSFDREAAERDARQIFQRNNAKRREELIHYFNNKIGLDEAITAEIFPTLVLIKTNYGIVGAGFFQHSEWLVSNAHIIPSKEILDSGIKILDHQSNELTLIAETSYHRPSHRNDAPDIVIIKTTSRYKHNSKCLPIEFSGDEGYKKSYLFYVDINSKGANSYAVKFLRLRSNPNTYPIIYECQDGSVPQPGCSGTPIIKARLISDRTPKWQFKVVGALYARCSANWYNNKYATEEVSEATKLVCAIPVLQDFQQILKLIFNDQNINRAQQIISACETATSLHMKRTINQQRTIIQANELEKQTGLKKFESGESILDISLPEDLEKLWYKGIVNLSKSLLIKEVRRKVAKGFSANIKDASYEDLKADFYSFMEDIKQKDNFKFYKTDTFDTSPHRYFRIDVNSKGHDYWMLDIQDNTGKNNDGKPYKFQNQPISSVFAKITIPKNITVTGSQLAELFITSQENEEVRDISSLPNKQPEKSFALKAPPNKKTEKNITNKQKYNEMKKGPDAFSSYHCYDEEYKENDGNSTETTAEAKPKQHVTKELEKIYRNTEILIPADGECLYASVFIGYLLPVISNEESLKDRLFRLLGDNKINLQMFSKLLWKAQQSIKLLKQPNFKEFIISFKVHMGLNKGWGGPEEIRELSQRLNIDIHVYIRNPDLSEENPYVSVDLHRNAIGSSSDRIYILQTRSTNEEVLEDSEDSQMQIGKIMSAEFDNQFQHYRLLRTEEVILHNENIEAQEKFPALNSKSSNNYNTKPNPVALPLGSSSAAILGNSIQKGLSITSKKATPTETVANRNNNNTESNNKQANTNAIVYGKR